MLYFQTVVFYKRCTHCKRELPLDAYTKDRSRYDGLMNRCRACNKPVGKMARENAKVRHRKHQAKYAALNPDKVRAHWQLAAALASGTVKRQPCAVCGASDTQGHHADYKRPLSVQWLCHAHHVREHHGRIPAKDAYAAA